jgi:hypothetical protein
MDLERASEEPWLGRAAQIANSAYHESLSSRLPRRRRALPLTVMEPVSTALPASLYQYFWDVDPAGLTLEGDRYTIVRGLLERGGLDGIVWLRREVGDDEIRSVLISIQGRGLEPRRLRFWQLVLGLPAEQVDA